MEYRQEHRLITAGVMTVLSVLCATIALGADQPSRPNIVYIALEDITPMMGCYGDTYAKTPNFDQLAAEGIRYTRAYSVGPVCSEANGLISVSTSSTGSTMVGSSRSAGGSSLRSVISSPNSSPNSASRSS